MMFQMKLSRIMLTFGVRDMGRISEVIDFGECAFGIGITCAFFQSIGILLSASDLLNMTSDTRHNVIVQQMTSDTRHNVTDCYCCFRNT